MTADRQHALRERRVMVRIGIIVLVALAAPATALAGGPPPPAAINQYVEAIPTGSGSSSVGATKKAVKALPKKTTQRIAKSGGADAALLEKVATSSDYGAPQQTLTPTASATPHDATRARKPAAKAGGSRVAPASGHTRKRVAPASGHTRELKRAPTSNAVGAGVEAAKSSHGVLLLVFGLISATILAIGVGAVARARRQP